MDIICFCHIRWNFVYQRPRHLLNNDPEDQASIPHPRFGFYGVIDGR